MTRILLRVGGVANALFVVFHVWLGYQIHTSPGIASGDRPLLEMLNAGGVLFILFFAISSLCYTHEMLGTPEAMDILEKEFGSKLTTRNWNTVLKVLA